MQTALYYDMPSSRLDEVHTWRLSLQTLGTREGTLQQELEQAKKDLKSARQAAVLAEASARRANGEAGEVEDKHRAELRAAHEETEVVSLAFVKVPLLASGCLTHTPSRPLLCRHFGLQGARRKRAARQRQHLQSATKSADARQPI